MLGLNFLKERQRAMGSVCRVFRKMQAECSNIIRMLRGEHIYVIYICESV
jgi:hypothetical protein